MTLPSLGSNPDPINLLMEKKGILKGQFMTWNKNFHILSEVQGEWTGEDFIKTESEAESLSHPLDIEC